MGTPFRFGNDQCDPTFQSANEKTDFAAKKKLTRPLVSPLLALCRRVRRNQATVVRHDLAY